MMKALVLRYKTTNANDQVKVWKSSSSHARIGMHACQMSSDGRVGAETFVFIRRRDAKVLRDWLTTYLKETSKENQK